MACVTVVAARSRFSVKAISLLANATPYFWQAYQRDTLHDDAHDVH